MGAGEAAAEGWAAENTAAESGSAARRGGGRSNNTGVLGSKRLLSKNRHFASFQNDASGNLEKLTLPSQASHTIGYDALSRNVFENPPALEGLLGGNPDSWRFTYDAGSAVTATIFLGATSAGEVVNYSYDDAGRLASVQSDVARHELSYSGVHVAKTSSSTGEEISHTYKGRLPETTTYTNIPSSGVNTTLQTKYKKQLPSSYQVGNNQEIVICYDAEDVPMQVGDLSISRDASTGFLAGTSMGNVSTSQTYYGFGATATTSAKFGSDELYGVSYSCDALGRIISSTESILGETYLRNYSYGGDDHLARAEVDGAITIYTYHSNGNRLNNQAFYDVQDRLVMDKDFLYSYTPRGSLKAKTKRSGGSNVTSYDYDLEGHLRQVALPDGALVSYGYDGYGRMVSRRQGNLVVGYLYKDQLEPVATVDATGNITAEFVYATKAHVPDYMLKNGKTYPIISDERGSVRLSVDVATGSIAQRIDDDAWGKVLADTNPGFQPVAYAGGIYDSETGLVKFRARDYDAGIGRWLGKDPIRFLGGKNLFSYTGNDPINLVDPSGLCDMPSARDGDGQPYPSSTAGCGGGGGVGTPPTGPGGSVLRGGGFAGESGAWEAGGKGVGGASHSRAEQPRSWTQHWLYEARVGKSDGISR